LSSETSAASAELAQINPAITATRRRNILKLHWPRQRHCRPRRDPETVEEVTRCQRNRISMLPASLERYAKKA
jgi:hypothetical protein